MKLVRGVVGGGGESGNVFAVTKLFSDDPKVPAWKESSVVLWCEGRGWVGGGKMGGLTASQRVTTPLWVGGTQYAALILRRRSGRSLKTRLILFTKCQVNTAADTRT